MNRLNIFSLIAFGTLIFGCAPRFYIPNTQNVPLLKKKSQTQIALLGKYDQLEIQGAYGLTDNIGLKVNGSLFVPSDEDNGNGGSGNLVEIGGGYFKAINKKFIFETYGILGVGYVENHLPSTVVDHFETTGEITAHLIKYGVQPDFGYESRNFSVIFSSRVIVLNYNNIKGNLIFQDINQVDYLKKNKHNLLIEPAITLRVGGKIQLQLQIGYSYNMSNERFLQTNKYLTGALVFNINSK